jgi:hypothetical protein
VGDEGGAQCAVHDGAADRLQSGAQAVAQVLVRLLVERLHLLAPTSSHTSCE